MNIKGKVHLMFEQSGTFKKEFKKLGYEAYDYDIQNEFNETDYVIDLFKEIENAYDNKPSIFDNITSDDLIMAFFPCIYFETIQQLFFALIKNDFRNKPMTYKINYALDRLEKRTLYHNMLYKLTYIMYDRKLRLIIENPATTPNYLITGQNFMPPTFIDKNRRLRGDYFVKPTAYWFINCEKTNGESFSRPKEKKTIQKLKGNKKGQGGVCSTERSMISSDYARNFICDFILGKQQKHSLLNLF